VKSKAVDHILEAMRDAQTMPALIDACRALDRVVMWNYWQMPELWFAAEPASYWDKFGIPAVRPKHFTIDSALSQMPAWPIIAWWIKDPKRR
jgi:peptide/nickel transport system substrate-binding protein/microcin C transport system substrate-binding protein